MMHSSTEAGSMPARLTASRTTIAPSSGAVKSFNAPRNFPVGTRTALTINASLIETLILTMNLVFQGFQLFQSFQGHRSVGCRVLGTAFRTMPLEPLELLEPFWNLGFYERSIRVSAVSPRKWARRDRIRPSDFAIASFHAGASAFT